MPLVRVKGLELSTNAAYASSARSPLSRAAFRAFCKQNAREEPSTVIDIKKNRTPIGVLFFLVRVKGLEPSPRNPEENLTVALLR